MIEYYTRPFHKFHEAIKGRINSDTNYLRQNYWGSISDGLYYDDEATKLIRNYHIKLEDKAKTIVEKYSIAYWLHLSRRIFPYTSGEDKRPDTIYLSRLNLDIAIQKYAKKNLCEHIVPSKEANIKNVFNGLLLKKKYQVEKILIEISPNMLILTDFDEQNLLEYYQLEKICYELWVCGAKLRSIAKGAAINVDNSSAIKFDEIRSKELDKLIKSYDIRSEGFIKSATGTVFSDSSLDKSSRFLVPFINIFEKDIGPYIEKLGELFNVKIVDPSTSNFIPLPIPLKKYAESHTPFTESFFNKNGLHFKSIIYFLAALVSRYFVISLNEKQGYIFHLIKRGYEGPMEKRVIISYVNKYIPFVEQVFEEEISLNEDEIVKALEYLSLDNQRNLRFLYPGTVKMILPVSNNMYYIDHSKIPGILENLFYDLDLDKQSFRGETLEKAVSKKQPYLPTYPLKGFDEKEKQIDYSIKVGKILVVVECKVVAKASSIYAGSSRSINYRKKQVIERGLKEADEKAKWLQKRPVGKNYTIEETEYILPIAVSPFKEYIHKIDDYYWINKDLPRVLTPGELNDLIEKELDTDDLFNLFEVDQNSSDSN